MDLFNKDTGEVVLEIKEPESPFRSLTDLKGYSDGEYYEPGSSMVDLTGYEPLDSIIARCTRVMRAPGGQEYRMVDVDALKQEAGTVTEIYDAGTATTLDEAFDTQDPTSDEDFDLVDASRILSKIAEKSDAVSGGVAPQIANDDDDKASILDAKFSEKDDEKDEVEKKATA